MSKPTLTLKTAATAGKTQQESTRPEQPKPKANHRVPPEELKRARAWLRKVLPTDKAPFKVGIREDLAARLPADISATALSIALGERVRTPFYLQAMLVSRDRYGLDGEVEQIAETDRIHAADRLLRLVEDGKLKDNGADQGAANQNADWKTRRSPREKV